MSFWLCISWQITEQIVQKYWRTTFLKGLRHIAGVRFLYVSFIQNDRTYMHTWDNIESYNKSKTIFSSLSHRIHSFLKEITLNSTKMFFIQTTKFLGITINEDMIWLHPIFILCKNLNTVCFTLHGIVLRNYTIGWIAHLRSFSTAKESYENHQLHELVSILWIINVFVLFQSFSVIFGKYENDRRLCFYLFKTKYNSETGCFDKCLQFYNYFPLQEHIMLSILYNGINNLLSIICCRFF